MYSLKVTCMTNSERLISTNQCTFLDTTEAWLHFVLWTPVKSSDQEPRNGAIKIKRSRTIFSDQDSWSRSQTLLQTTHMWLPLDHGQSNSSMATTRTENTHGLTYPVPTVIDITAWQSVNTVCLCCLTHGVCVSHWTPPSSHNSAMEMARVLSSVHAISMTSVHNVLNQPVCSMLVHYS